MLNFGNWESDKISWYDSRMCLFVMYFCISYFFIGKRGRLKFGNLEIDNISYQCLLLFLLGEKGLKLDFKIMEFIKFGNLGNWNESR